MHTGILGGSRKHAEPIFSAIVNAMSTETLSNVQHGRPSSYQKGCRCLDCKTAQRHYVLARKAGLSIYEFNDLWSSQNEQCAVCSWPEAGLVLDDASAIWCPGCRDASRVLRDAHHAASLTRYLMTS